MSTACTVLAFDIGASSGRAILGHFDGTILRLEEVHRFWNGTVKLRGHLYWDLPRLFDEMQNGLQKACAAQCVASFGVDTWGVDGAFLGPHQELLGLPWGYRDFSVENMQACVAAVGARKLYNVTGVQFMPFNTIFQFYHHKQHRHPFLKLASRYLFMPDLLRFLFTGEAQTEYTIASTSQLLDAQTRGWSEPLLRKVGMKPAQMGEIIPPGTLCGTAEGTDVKAVAVAGHDTGSAVLAVPADTRDEQWAWLSSGTWSIMGIETGTPIISAKGRTLNFSNEGGANGTIRFLKNIMGLWLAQECRRLWAAQGQEYSFAQLTELAAQAPAGGPRVDVNDMRFYAPANMIEEIRAACRDKGQRAPETVGEMYRCILESLAAAYASVLRELRMLTGKTFTRLHVVGGGAQNALLNQLTADACGMPVIAGPVEATAIGNALMQLVACGAISSVAEGRALVRASFPTEDYQPRH
jgi:sugar (pentulose or hexulose) kinase